MRSQRLEHALSTSALALPTNGRIAVFRPRAGDDLSALPRDRVQVATGFRPDFDWFAAAGLDVRRLPEGAFATALVCLPRSRAHARDLIARAAALVGPAGQVWVDGQKTDGAESLFRELRDAGLAPTVPVAKAHGKLFGFRPAADLSAWIARPTRNADGFLTLPGVFSADAADAGSAQLAGALPDSLPATVADLGASWGYLSRAALRREGVRELHLVEAEADALDCARRNVEDPRARFHWADATRFTPERRFDAVLCNPPFHTGRRADPQLGLDFLRAAAAMLMPSGTLWLVANRHLPYVSPLAELFRSVEEIGGDSRFRLIRASYPQRKT
ncbi:MAG: class I SAM-dependent methyltransferase [Gemmobacter sp.]